jgi:hypothetical protein
MPTVMSDDTHRGDDRPLALVRSSHSTSSGETAHFLLPEKDVTAQFLIVGK